MIDFRYFNDLVFVLTKKDIKSRYKTSVLGYLWSIINPLAFAAIFYVIFQVVMRFDMQNYALFLVTGLFTWQWINNSAIAGTMVFIQNASLIKKIIFPRSILPLSIVLQDAFHFLMSVPVIIVLLLIFDKTPSWNWFIGIPVLLVIQCTLTYGLSLLLASINLFFRDVEKITGLLFTALFYMTPILFPISKIPEDYRIYILLNPFTPIVIAWRELFIDGVIFSKYTLYSFGYAILFLIVGVVVYRKLRWKFAEVL